MILVGIDPGYGRCGFAVLERNSENKEILLHSECFSTDAKSSFEERLLLVTKRFRKLTEIHKPDICSLEKLYLTNNHKTAMRVAEARGVLILTAHEAGIPIYEYGPKEIKIAVTGTGAATKQQVMLMIPKLITIDKDIKYDDEFDAIATGLTAAASIKYPRLSI